MPVGAVEALGPQALIAGLGPEAAIGRVAHAEAPQQGAGFGAALADAIGELNGVQRAADTQAQLFATGQARDLTEVVVAAERAQLAMQFATSLRNKTVDAVNELMRTQI